MSAGVRTWRLPLRVRLVWLALIPAALVLILLFALALTVLVDTGGSVTPLDSVSPVLAVFLFLGYLFQVWRSWLTRVTLTADTLVIQNGFTSQVVPLANIAKVRFAGDVLRVIEHSPAAQGPWDEGTRAAGRRARATRHTVRAVGGRRAAADAIAQEIAAAAGLSGPPPRQPAFGTRGSAALVTLGPVLITVGIILQAHVHSHAHVPPFLAALAGASWSSGVGLLILGVKARR